jgi:hypothetical protein
MAEPKYVGYGRMLGPHLIGLTFYFMDLDVSKAQKYIVKNTHHISLFSFVLIKLLYY